MKTIIFTFNLFIYYPISLQIIISARKHIYLVVREREREQETGSSVVWKRNTFIDNESEVVL